MHSDDFTDESRHMQALELGYQMDQQDDARYNSQDTGRGPDLDLPTKATNSSDVSLLSEFRPGSRGKFGDCSLLPTLSTQKWELEMASSQKTALNSDYDYSNYLDTYIKFCCKYRYQDFD